MASDQDAASSGSLNLANVENEDAIRAQAPGLKNMARSVNLLKDAWPKNMQKQIARAILHAISRMPPLMSKLNVLRKGGLHSHAAIEHWRPPRDNKQKCVAVPTTAPCLTTLAARQRRARQRQRLRPPQVGEMVRKDDFGL